ncbi:hypothetical protein BH23ACT5_BH23ACT5_22520 [soil metagenome]
MTYSVIAYDPDSGAYGVAVQSHWFNVGRSAPWVRFGVGAVVTQALTDPSYGWRGLDSMADGTDAVGSLRSLLDGDPDQDRRQVAFIDAAGEVAAHTGSRCIRHAGHVVGGGWAVLGNLLATTEVVPAMAEVFVAAPGTLAERMVSTLEAAEAHGGDLRGVQSAAIRVVPGASDLDEGMEAGVDIRVEDHDDPVGELRRLVTVDRAYRELRRGETAIAGGAEALALHHLTLSESLRHGVEVDFWRAVALARLGHHPEAARVLTEVFEVAPQFEEVLVRVAEVDPVAAEMAARMR